MTIICVNNHAYVLSVLISGFLKLVPYFQLSSPLSRESVNVQPQNTGRYKFILFLVRFAVVFCSQAHDQWINSHWLEIGMAPRTTQQLAQWLFLHLWPLIRVIAQLL